MEKLKLEQYNLTTAQIAAKLHYHPQHVRVLAIKKKLPALKRGRAWLFNEEQVLKHLQAEAEKNAGGNTDGSSILQ